MLICFNEVERNQITVFFLLGFTKSNTCITDFTFWDSRETFDNVGRWFFDLPCHQHKSCQYKVSQKLKEKLVENGCKARVCLPDAMHCFSVSLRVSDSKWSLILVLNIIHVLWQVLGRLKLKHFVTFADGYHSYLQGQVWGYALCFVQRWRFWYCKHEILSQCKFWTLSTFCWNKQWDHFDWQEIKRTGIRPFKDPRLRYVIQNMSKYKPKPNVSLETLNLNFEQFKDVLSGNLPLLVKIFRNDLVVPEFATFCESVTTLYNKLKDNFDGAVSIIFKV